jgi:hypothetical protein
MSVAAPALPSIAALDRPNPATVAKIRHWSVRPAARAASAHIGRSVTSLFGSLGETFFVMGGGRGRR